MADWYLPRSLRSAMSSALTGPLPSATDMISLPSTESLTTASDTVEISSPIALKRRSTITRKLITEK
jgi:hypothetical protein